MSVSGKLKLCFSTLLACRDHDKGHKFTIQLSLRNWYFGINFRNSHLAPMVQPPQKKMHRLLPLRQLSSVPPPVASL